MKHKAKKMIVIIVLLLAIGFAAVSTSLIINGNALFGTNTDDFDVIFTKSVIDGIDVSDLTISDDGKSLSFTTSNLAIKDDKSVLNFEVTNNSTQYDADITMECINKSVNLNNYYKIENTIPDIITAATTGSGSVTVTLLKSSVEEITETFTCTISATAIEREDAAVLNRSEIGVTATDLNNTDLNARAYEITGTDKSELLDSLVETGYVETVADVDALIEVKSDDFDSIANTIFNVSSIASVGDTVVILHFNESTQEWEYIGTETVDANGEVKGDFTTYSPVAFIVIKEDGTIEKIQKNLCKNDNNVCIIKGTGDVRGDIIKVGDQEFYVITNNGTTIKMMAMYNVDIETHRQTEEEKLVVFGTSTDYNGSYVETYANAYAEYLNNEYAVNASGTIITKDELGELGCDLDNNRCNTSEYAWVYSVSYWINTPVTSETYTLGVHRVGYISSGSYAGSNFGVRPVITMSANLIK